MTIQADFEDRFDSAVPPIVWVDAVAGSWTAYTCLAYSDSTKEAILNLIAHLLVVDAMPGTSAARTAESKSVGSVSVSYGAATSGSNMAIRSEEAFCYYTEIQLRVGKVSQQAKADVVARKRKRKGRPLKLKQFLLTGGEGDRNGRPHIGY